MSGNIVAFLVGVVCVVLGISNMRGNISSLHSYHRQRHSSKQHKCFFELVTNSELVSYNVIYCPEGRK